MEIPAIEVTKTYKYVATISLCLSSLAYGIGSTILGPALEDIKRLLGVDDEDVSYGFVSRSVVYCFIALLCGYLFKKFNRQLLFALCLLLLGISAALIPHSGNFTWFLVLQGVTGVATAGIDAAGNVWLLEMWQEKSNPYVQSMHFMYALGSTLSPLLCAPFLSPEANDTDRHDNKSEAILFNPVDATNFESDVYIPFAICGALCSMAAILITVLHVVRPYTEPERSIDSKVRARAASDMSLRRVVGVDNHFHGKSVSTSALVAPVLPKYYYYLVIGFGAFLICFYQGLEVNSFNYLSTFAVKSSLQLTKKQGAFMTSVMGASFAVSRATSVLLAMKLKSTVMIYIDLAIIAIGSVLLIAFGETSETMLWVSVIVMGLGFASVFPTTYVFLEERVDVTNTLSGILLFVGYLSPTIYPVFEGKYIESNPQIFVYITVFSISGSILCFLGMHSTDWLKKKLLLRKTSTM